VFVVATSFQARPAPGGHGQALGVALVLVAFCGATIAAMRLTRAPPAVQLAVPLLAVASAATLVGLQANGAVFLGVFPALGFAALVLPVRLSAVVAGAAIAAVSAAWVAYGRAPIAGIVLNDFAIVAIYLLSLFARRLRESNQRAELLLAELEQTRAAAPAWLGCAGGLVPRRAVAAGEIHDDVHNPGHARPAGRRVPWLAGEVWAVTGRDAAVPGAAFPAGVGRPRPRSCRMTGRAGHDPPRAAGPVAGDGG